MKNLFKTIFSVLFALALTSPVEALASPCLDSNDFTEEERTYSSESRNDNYVIRFLRSDFCLISGKGDMSDQADSLMMFMTNPKGKIVKDAQVVVTTVSQSGQQIMSRALPYKGGYFINTEDLTPGYHRLDLEIITDGWLLTDQFHFEHS